MSTPCIKQAPGAILNSKQQLPRIRCGGKNKNGSPCKAWAVHGRRHCRMHGGKSLAGAANGNFKHGRYSKYLPIRLLEQYEDSRGDDEQLKLTEQIALLDTRIADLLLRADSGESGQLWRDTQKAYHQMQLAMDKGDRDKVSDALADLEVLLERGHADYLAWDEVQRVIELRRRLVESEQKRLQMAGQYLSTHQALTLVQALIMSVKSHVSDREILNAIQNDLTRIIGQQSG